MIVPAGFVAVNTQGLQCTAELTSCSLNITRVTCLKWFLHKLNRPSMNQCVLRNVPNYSSLPHERWKIFSARVPENLAPSLVGFQSC